MVNIKPSYSKIMEEDSIPETDVSKEFLNFFVDELKDIYWAEKQMTKALAKMQKAAATLVLKNAFAGHTATTHVHVERLEQIFDALGETPRARKCEAIAELIEEANNIIEETEKGTHLRDACLVIAAQKADHYEIATYGGLVQLARTMGNEDIIALLEETLAEENEEVELLTALAEGGINGAAAKEGLENQMKENAASV